MIDKLIHATSNDRLGIGLKGAPVNGVMAATIWFMLMKEAQLVVENQYGGLSAMFLGRFNLIQAIEIARRDWEDKEKRR